MDNTIKILIVDDHAVVRKGLIMVLRLEPDFEIVGEAENGRQAVQLAQQLQPDLLLLDLMMPEMDGEQTMHKIRALMPKLRILMLTGIESDDRILNMVSAGIDGYVMKDIEPDELASAVRRVAHGEAYLPPGLMQRVVQHARQQNTPTAPQATLTPREKEVLRWMATPATYRQIAAQLFVSEETIRSHAKRILSKLQQPNRGQAVLEAVRAGFIELAD